MALPALCSCATTKYATALLLTFVLLQHILHRHIVAATDAATPTASATSRADPVRLTDRRRQNTLADDIAHEEFIDSDSNQPHSRRKRLVWITDDGRLALPPGTSLTFTPTIAMPLVRHPPEGFFSNVSISFPLTIDFDKLGLTDESNPLGDLPPIFTREIGRSAGRMLGDYVTRYLHYRKRRDLTTTDSGTRKMPANPQFRVETEPYEESQELPKLPDSLKHVFHGGERVLLYGVVEDLLATFGLNGKACLLRTICEVHSRSLERFGVLGEMTKLFLTVTKSPFSEHIPEYVRAQQIGEGREAPGECFPYYKECPKSIFKDIQKEKYSNDERGEYHENNAQEVLQQKLPEKLTKGTVAKAKLKRKQINEKQKGYSM